MLLFVKKTMCVVGGVLWLSITLLSAQEQKFGKISPEEWAMKTYPLDSNANAVVLFDVGKSYFKYHPNEGFKMIFERHTRIKILNKQGYDYADIQIPLYHNNSREELLTGLKAETHEMLDGKLVSHKLEKSAIFKEKLTERWGITKFGFPNVKEGSIIEYTYTIQSDFFLNLRDWTFQRDIPVMWSEYDVVIPEYYYYKRFFQGYIGFHKNVEENTNGTITFGAGDPPVNYRATHYLMVAKDVPAFKDEQFITTPNDYLSKIYFQLASIMYPNRPVEDLSNSWEKIAANLREDPDFGGQLKKKGLVAETVALVTAGAASPEEKAAKIYSFIQNTVKWDEINSYYSIKGIRKTLDEKTGNSGDINLLLINMLREADIQADPVILGTRRSGRLLSFYPSEEKVNYVVALVKLGEKYIFLDAVDDLTPFGMLPYKCLSGEGYLIKDDAQQWISLDGGKESNHTCNLVLTMDENGKIQGDMQHMDKGYLQHTYQAANPVGWQGKICERGFCRRC
ncbi:MAG: transglutaminase domain-containing protein [Microscillaceae bacterium]|nr:transglutaminase domain-containing protein [Microscillaceae bacterium]